MMCMNAPETRNGLTPESTLSCSSPSVTFCCFCEGFRVRSPRGRSTCSQLSLTEEPLSFGSAAEAHRGMWTGTARLRRSGRSTALVLEMCVRLTLMSAHDP